MDLAVCLWAVLPGAILWGASFPLALAAAAGPGQAPGCLVAGVYAANMVGAILGALAFSLVFVPVIGTQWSQRVLLALSATSAAVVLAPPLWSRARSPGLRPARSVLVVACGAGVTAGSFVPYKSVERIVLCEIEPMVLERVAPVFAAENNNVLGDPRTQVVVDDGRHFIRTTKETFDVITSDLLDPWVKGCAALSTREYYEMYKAHLSPGGVMTVWVPLYESDLETVKTSIATFFQVFPNDVIWSNEAEGQGYDAVLLGRVDPVGKTNVDDLQDWLDRHPAVAGSLEEVGFGSGRVLTRGYGEIPELSVDLLATYAGQARDIAGWLRGAQINTDRNLRLQYMAGMALNRFLRARLLREILAHYRFPDNLIEGSGARLAALEEQLAESGRHPSARGPR